MFAKCHEFHYNIILSYTTLYLLLLRLRTLLLHPLAPHKIPCFLLYATQSLARVAVLAGLLHCVDRRRFVFLPGGLPCGESGGLTDGFLYGMLVLGKEKDEKGRGYVP